MKEKNSGSVGRLPNRPVLWWKLIQIMKQMKKIEIEQINVLSEEDRPVCSIVIPKEGAISPSHNPSLNKSMLTIRYGICYNFICIVTWVHLRWRCFGSFSGLECSQLGDGRKTSVNDNLIARQELSKSFTPPELYSLCQPKSCLQHNLRFHHLAAESRSSLDCASSVWKQGKQGVWNRPHQSPDVL